MTATAAAPTTGRTLTAEDLLAGAALTHRVSVPPALLQGAAEGAGDGGSGAVLLRPLVLADVMRLHRAAGDDDELASALMVQLALVEPALSLDQVHRLPAGMVEWLLGEVNRTSGLSLGEAEVADAVHAPLARACFTLSQAFGWTPERCTELTLGQVLLYLEMLGRGEAP